MTNPQPDYKTLYEQGQKRLAEAELKTRELVQENTHVQQQLQEVKQKLHLALLDANALRRKLFGIKTDNRVSKASENQLALFSLGATPQDIARSEQALACLFQLKSRPVFQLKSIPVVLQG